MAEPGAAEAYEATRIAFELGEEVRHLRERNGWSQSQLAHAAGMTQSAVARFEAGGTVPTLACSGAPRPRPRPEVGRQVDAQRGPRRLIRRPAPAGVWLQSATWTAEAFSGVGVCPDSHRRCG